MEYWGLLVNSDCIEFSGCKDTGGYGLKRKQGKLYKAHRLAWIEANGPIPEGLFVCHKCDNPACINLDHLFLGTNSDNMKDMYNKERGNNYFKVSNPKQKINQTIANEIKELRKLGLTQQHIANLYEIDRSLVSQIDRGIIW